MTPTTATPPVVQSWIADRWIGSDAGAVLASAIDGRPVGHAHADRLDFGEALAFARTRGLPALLAMDFQERAARLKKLAAYLAERKEALYAVSRHTGATRADGWVDIEGGTGTLYAYASIGGNELPSGNLLHEGPVASLGKTGAFAGTHVLVPRGGVAVHINAFNFPIWGLLEKFAPTFLAGMPTIAKPATATSYLTEAMVRLVAESGLLPPGALQLVIGSTGDLLDRLEGQDVVTFTGSADTAAKLRAHPNLIARSVPFNAEADSLNAALLGPDVTPDDPEFDLFVKEVAREMTVKAGQKCTVVAPTLLVCRTPGTSDAVHDVEAFGPVSTLMPYGDWDEALALAARGKGSLVATLATHDPALVARSIPAMAAWHGRLHILDREAAAESTGHGSPLPGLKHGGPGRAGGGEELGGVRAVKHYLQRAALQGSPTMLAAAVGEHVRGAAVRESDVHPFRRHFEDLAVGDSLLTHRRTVTEADIVQFGGISGDFFYMHFDAIAAAASPFGRRIAHGYFVLSAAAGLFVSPAPGPVLANYGLDTLRFTKPVAIGDTIRARLTCKRKVDRRRKGPDGVGQGVVAWDVEVTNQDGETVASYDILTLVAKRG
jgi:acyl-CoA reductase-like NAD-dependent aldehyde dehydrogenase/acyl dehydratase